MSPPPGRLELDSLPASWRNGLDQDVTDVGFPVWLSETWADVVAHPDPNERSKHRKAGPASTTPEPLGQLTPAASGHISRSTPLSPQRSTSITFHSCGVSRNRTGPFLGSWNMERISLEVPVDAATAVIVARTARRWSVARDRTRANWAVSQGRPYRRRRRPLMASGAGYVLVGNGSTFAESLARVVWTLSQASIGKCRHTKRWPDGNKARYPFS